MGIQWSRKGLFVLGMMVCASTAAMAEDQSSGCGMGWKVVNKNSLFSSTTRAYINATFSSTIGMTSGTSGCAKHSIVMKDKQAVHYAEVNKGQLMIEMAAGEGEHLRSLAALMGCSKASGQFGEATQRSYQRIFPSSATPASEVLSGVRAVIQEDSALVSQCGITG